jgi:hypothetical protein
MKSNNFKKTGILATLGILFLLAFAGTKPSTTGTPKTTSPTTTISRTLPLQQIKRLFPRAATDGIVLNIYPVKHSTDPQKNDFELIIFALDKRGREVLMSGRLEETLFKKQSACYVRFLHRQAIRKDDIPQGYQLRLNGASFGANNTLDLHIYLPPGTEMSYALPKPNLLNTRKRLDSLPICKCPPCCPWTNVAPARATLVRSIIGKEYVKL